jgi:cytochrome b subunit of formate dehydrogenase
MSANPATKNAASSGPVTKTYRISWRDAVDAAMRLRTDHRGRRYVNRFTTAKVIEHFVVTISVIALALTGFTQTYYSSAVGSNVLAFFGGIDIVRQVHHIFAFILGFTFIYHLFNYLNDVFVFRRSGRLWFTRDDVLMLLKLGGSRKPIRFDRYTLNEKVSYWLLLMCIMVLGTTGLIQAFPITAIKVLPGTIVPFARIFHHWVSILCVLTVVIWHLYDVVLRKFNLSIFTGNLSIKNMEQDHPLELQYLEKAAAVANNTKWPVKIEIVTEEAPVAEPVKAVPAAKTPEAVEQAARPAEEAKKNKPAEEERQ